MKTKLTPHERIMVAFSRGTGLRLDPLEVRHLANDDAIFTAAENAGLCIVCFGKGKRNGEKCANCIRGRLDR